MESVQNRVWATTLAGRSIRAPGMTPLRSLADAELAQLIATAAR
jgi:hypothetical protein